MTELITTPFPIFTDVDGNPLEDGYIYIGEENQNPEVVPISVYWDEALTIPAAQPIRTIGGYPSRSGSPGRIFIASNYSITVRNKNSSLIYTLASEALLNVYDKTEIDVKSRLWQNETIVYNVIADSDYTLSADQNTYGRIKITDTGVVLSAARNVVTDNVQKRFVFINNTLQSLTVKTSAGTGIQVPAGQTMDLYNDGTNVVEAVSNSEGFKNLLINPNRTIQQRGTTGGRRQVIDASNIELGGSYVISHGGSATVRIYEAVALGASDAATTWSELTSGASASGTVVTVTAGRYIKVEFSTTDFSFPQFEKGTIPSGYEQRAAIELLLCYPYYEITSTEANRNNRFNTGIISAGTGMMYLVPFKNTKRITPSVILYDSLGAAGVISLENSNGNVVVDGHVPTVLATKYHISVAATISGYAGVRFTWIANAEHFSDTYYEDRWF